MAGSDREVAQSTGSRAQKAKDRQSEALKRSLRSFAQRSPHRLSTLSIHWPSGATRGPWVSPPQRSPWPVPADQAVIARTFPLSPETIGPPESPVQAPAPPPVGSAAQSKIEESGVRVARFAPRSTPALVPSPSRATP